MSWIRVATFNVIILVCLLCVLELGARLAWTVNQCLTNECDKSRLTELSIHKLDFVQNDENLGLSRYDELLGYVPREGFDSIIDKPGSIPSQAWRNNKVTINTLGFRTNGASTLNQGELILTVGDSFTFGDQVSNEETWPACLEQTTNFKVYNGGVFGYGAAQAVRRAMVETKKLPIDILVLSILISDDFHRGQLLFRSGFPKPAVIEQSGKLGYSKVPPKNSTGTKYNPSKRYTFVTVAYENSMLFSRLIKGLDIDITGRQRTEKHPQAGSVEDIVDFTLSEFSKLKATKKLIVFQYNINDLGTERAAKKDTQHYRNLTIKLAEQKKLRFVDTYEDLFHEHVTGTNNLWHGHHTPYGNRVVCKIIREALSH